MVRKGIVKTKYSSLGLSLMGINFYCLVLNNTSIQMKRCKRELQKNGLLN